MHKLSPILFVCDILLASSRALMSMALTILSQEFLGIPLFFCLWILVSQIFHWYFVLHQLHVASIVSITSNLICVFLFLSLPLFCPLLNYFISPSVFCFYVFAPIPKLHTQITNKVCKLVTIRLGFLRYFLFIHDHSSHHMICVHCFLYSVIYYLFFAILNLNA